MCETTDWKVSTDTAATAGQARQGKASAPSKTRGMHAAMRRPVGEWCGRGTDAPTHLLQGEEAVGLPAVRLGRDLPLHLADLFDLFQTREDEMKKDGLGQVGGVY